MIGDDPNDADLQRLPVMKSQADIERVLFSGHHGVLGFFDDGTSMIRTL